MPGWVGWTYYVSEWIIRVVMLIYVPQRRSPAAARAWLLLILLFPWPGLLLYFLIGRPRLARSRIAMQQRISQIIRSVEARNDIAQPQVASELPEQLAQAAQLARSLGDFELLSGNDIQLIDNYQESIDRLAEDIAEARHHIHLLYYIFGDDRAGNQIGNALLDAQRRGVICRLLMDAAGAKHGLKTIGRRLRAAGIEVNALLPVNILRRSAGRFDLRNHRKIAVIDGRIGYTGSQNIVDADFRKGLVYEEVAVRVTGPVVRQLQAVFLADRYFETEQEADLAGLFPEARQPGGALAMAVPSGPGFPRKNNLDLIVTLIHEAMRRVVITSPYFIPNEALLEAMESAAIRGVDVRLVVCQQMDKWIVGLAQRSFYSELLESGVRIHAYRPRFLHAKHVSIDDAVSLIGSSNMDIRSFMLNAEISMLIYDLDVAAKLREIQERYFANSEELKLESWTKRSPGLKLAENMARLADSLL